MLGVFFLAVSLISCVTFLAILDGFGLPGGRLVMLFQFLAWIIVHSFFMVDLFE